MLDSFVKRKDFLVCVDSDGCVMDTMRSKHVYCFGPCMVDEWGLGEWRDEILTSWNAVNLYRITRGINRFKGLSMALSEIDERYTEIVGLDALKEWCAKTDVLSEDALAEAVTESEGEGKGCLSKALSWSRAVNEKIKALPERLRAPFSGAREGLLAAREIADVALVSSANREAVSEEWERFGLLDCVDVMLTQEVGDKSFCISEMLKLGYDRRKVLMIGDAVGDMNAAKDNGVYYFPIIPGKEAESWSELKTVALDGLKYGAYGLKYQERKISEFINSFEKTR